VNGAISVFVTETAHVIVDINGYYIDMPAAGGVGVVGPTGATGAAGPMGPIGLTGPSGVNGVSGYERVSAVISLPDAFVMKQLSCPSGKRVLSGGWTLPDNDSRINVTYRGGYPSTDQTWTFWFHNADLAAVVTLYIICANAP